MIIIIRGGDGIGLGLKQDQSLSAQSHLLTLAIVENLCVVLTLGIGPLRWRPLCPDYYESFVFCFAGSTTLGSGCGLAPESCREQALLVLSFVPFCSFLLRSHSFCNKLGA